VNETREDGYDGAAQLLVGDAEITVDVKLRGQFDPISGKYRWYGRVTGSPQVAELVANGARAVLVRTPHGQAETALSDVDPWGRPRVEGFGRPPFPVLTSVPDTDS
jgi:hypothetical protein